MKKIDRRGFIANSSLVMAGLALSHSPFASAKKHPLLSFSTLGCPKWTLSQVINFASANGYDGIEIRGILGEVDLPKCPDFSTKASIAASRKMAEDKNIKFVNLGASSAMHISDPVKRKQSLDSARQFIDIAHDLNCPNIRVFPNDLPKDNTRKATVDLIVNGLKELAQYAKGSNVTVLMETHGDAVETSELADIMERTESPNTGLVWDFYNMWSITKESPTLVYQQLKKYIRHTHIKDGKQNGDKLSYVLLGEGDAPVRETIKVLEDGGYKGYYSFEWEKLWHPEILEPEIALAQYPKAIKKYFNS